MNLPSFPTGTEGVAFKSIFLSYVHFLAYRGSRPPAPTMPPPSMPPPPRSLLPVGIGGWHHLGQSTFSGQLATPSRWATPVAIEAQQWSTPKAGDVRTWWRPRLVDTRSGQHIDFLLGAPGGSYHMLTLVNARVRVGTVMFIVSRLFLPFKFPCFWGTVVSLLSILNTKFISQFL